MNIAAGLMMLFSVLAPSRIWYPPNMPLTIANKSEAAVTLVLTDFSGKAIAPKGSAELGAGAQVDIRPIFAELATPGTFVLYAVPKGKALPAFVGVPVVVEVRNDRRPNNPNPAEVLVIKMEPLRYLKLETDAGTISAAMYYDVAPNTVSTILGLASEGYYDGLTFHRIVPGFVVQAGDPLGDSRGGPGFQMDAEFNDRKHEEGVLSMARAGDPLEGSGAKPRHEYADSAGSQFFICLGKVERLDNKYTAFGKVVAGMEVVRKLGATPIADAKTGKPVTAPVIKKAEARVVTAEENPYLEMMGMKK